MIKNLSHLILGAILGAVIYDLAINLRISYNKDTLQVYCKKGIMFQQIHEDAEVFVKTNQECINKTEKGIKNDNRNTTQNPS